MLVVNATNIYPSSCCQIETAALFPKCFCWSNLRVEISTEHEFFGPLTSFSVSPLHSNELVFKDLVIYVCCLLEEDFYISPLTMLLRCCFLIEGFECR